MVQITVEGLERSFGERQVLRGLDAAFEGGERWLIRGRNGSGKTTFLKILAGLLEPTSGRVRVEVDGEELAPDWRRSLAGYLSPDLVLYDELTCLENLDLFGRLRGLGRDLERDQALLDRFGAGDRAHDRVGTLSTGLRQRVKLAFAVQTRPLVLFLDEPGSNLDAPGRDLVTEVVDEASGRGGIVTVATNDPAEFALGTRILELG